jgi:hypothetical protein
MAFHWQPDWPKSRFTELTAVPLGTERMHTLTNQIAEGLTVFDVAPSRQEIIQAVETIVAGRQQRLIMMLAIEGGHVPTRPKTARGRRAGRKCQRAKRSLAGSVPRSEGDALVSARG